MRTKNKFYLLFTGTLLLLTACNNQEDNSARSQTQDSVIIDNIVNEVVNDVIVNKPTTSTFTFNNLKNQSSILNVKNDVYDFTNIKQPIVMVSLASTWCPPCRGEVPHLNSLQKKFKDNLFILSALVYDDIKDEELKKLIISEKVHFYVSTDQKENLKFSDMVSKKLGIVDNFTLPLMILFANGKYFTHYEGSMPEEMIESDIRQLLEKIKRQETKG